MTKSNFRIGMMGFIYYFAYNTLIELVAPNIEIIPRIVGGVISLLAISVIYMVFFRKKTVDTDYENDERHKYVVERAGTFTFYCTFLVVIALIVIFSILGNEEIANNFRLLFIAIMLIYAGSFVYFRRKY